MSCELAASIMASRSSSVIGFGSTLDWEDCELLGGSYIRKEFKNYFLFSITS